MALQCYALQCGVFRLAGSLAWHSTTASPAETMPCCNGCGTAVELDLRHRALTLPSSGQSIVRGNIPLVLCTTRLVTGAEQEPTVCAFGRRALRRSGV